MAIKPISPYVATKQEFLNSVVNKIGRQEFSDQAWSNPLKRFKGGFIENASDIEEIYVAKAVSGAFDPNGSGVLDRAKPTVSVEYHTNNVEHAYKVSIQDKMVRKGFHTNGGVSKVADHILQSMHNSAQLDEYKDILDVLKALISDSAVAKRSKKVLPIPNNDVSAKALVKEIKKAIPKMCDWSNTYSSVENFTKQDKLVLFIDSDVDVEIDTEYLAGLFNLSKAELNNTTKVVVPNLNTKVGSYCILLDERCLKIHPTYYNVESIRNTRGKFTNYDLVVESLLSYTTWYPCLFFATA